MAVPINIDTTLGFLSHAVVLCCILYGGLWNFSSVIESDFEGHDSGVLQQLLSAIRAKLDFSTVVKFLRKAISYSTISTAAVYNYTVTNQGNPLALAEIDPVAARNLIIELIFSGMIAFLVQHFYCHRIYALSHSWLLAGFVSMTSLGSLGTIILVPAVWIKLTIRIYHTVTLYYFIGVVLSQYTELAQLALLDNVSIATNVLGIVSDLAITFLMIYLLQRSKTGFRNTTDVLNKLIVFTFNTGIPTSLLSILTLILLEGVPGTFIYIFVYVSLGRFYTNCLLVTLNSRDYIRQGLSSNGASTSENYAMSIPNNALESRLEFAGSDSTAEPISIRIDRDIHTSSTKHRRGDSIELP
ncbi:hypothetical protein EV360DRAFT_80429 [Lentinula raphanica]|nr:hypothetical protein EV360DRAFT_80429 [Lentinula raphanica]